MLTWAILSILVAVVFSGFFSAAEIAYFSLTEARVRTMKNKGVRNAALVAKLKANPDKLLTVILIGNNLVNIGSSAVMTYAMTQLYGSEGVGLATGIMTLVILTFGEIVPKSMATRFSQRIALISAVPLRVMQVALFPLVILFEQVSKLPRLLFKTRKTNLVTDDDMASMAAIGYDQGELLDYERDTITNVLKLNDIQVGKIMTPKSQMEMLASHSSLHDVVKQSRFKHLSRVPVYDGHKDEVIGFLFLKDILNHPRSEWDTLTARHIVRRILHLRDTDMLHNVYKRLLHNRIHLALVFDANEVLLGMVTLEDVIEEVLGEIYDETDPVL